MVTERKETKQMQSTFEKLGGTYRQEGDYLLPNVEVPESPAIGIWGQRRRKTKWNGCGGYFPRHG